MGLPGGGAPATHVTEPVQLGIGEHWECLRFVVVDVMIEPIILGLAWLDKWKPTIWWEGGYRKLRLELSPEPSTTEATGQVAGGLKGTEKSLSPEVPDIDADLAAVFNEEECDVLPLHCAKDCAIELLPGAKLPKSRMYAMTPREVEELHKYKDKNLSRGFIQPS